MKMKTLGEIFEGYKIFVESFESEERLLEAGTSVIYEVS
jgi:hypothetical protein